MKTNNKQTIPGIELGLIFTIFILLLILLIGICLSGIMPYDENMYNSYVLQAQRFLTGHLDLGQNYEWLEIAQYKSKFYISFPPFPTYIYLPFVAIFGDGFRDGWFCIITFLISGINVYSIFRHCKISQIYSAIFTVAFTAGTNLLFICVNSWVWFIAQSMSFALTTGAILFALKGCGVLSLSLLVCAVGCRPFQVIYFPLICIIYYKAVNRLPKISDIKIVIIPLFIAISYMVLNYLRFDNPFEFGHNYLPEFINAENGQFSLRYLKTNLYSLIRLPRIDKSGIHFQRFDGFCMFIASPPLIYALIYGIKNTKKNLLVFALIIIELLVIAMHKTMGGWHYGNRYTIDTIPLFVMLVCNNTKKQNTEISILLGLVGVLLNLHWISIFN